MKLLPLILLAGSVLAAQAQSVLFSVSLDGAQEVPSVATAGIGSGSLTLDATTGAISYNISYSGLIGLSSLMHIHLAPPGVNGGVIYNFTGAGFTAGATAGSVIGSGSFPLADIPNLIAGNTYVNIHSTSFGGGEIRGQLLVVPEPTVAALGGLAGLALVVWRRRH